MTFTISHISYSWVFVVFSRTFRRPPALDAKGQTKWRETFAGNKYVVSGKNYFFPESKKLLCFQVDLGQISVKYRVEIDISHPSRARHWGHMTSLEPPFIYDKPAPMRGSHE